MRLFRNLATVAMTAGLAFSVPQITLAEEDATFREVTVGVEADAAKGGNALAYYPDLAKDLEGYILAELPVSDDPNGFVVQVTVQSITLDGDTMLPDSREFNEMQGVALVTSPETNAAPHAIPIMLAARTGDDTVPEGYVAVTPGTDDFYTAMLMAFAGIVGDEVPAYAREAGSK